jgi:hypothetical protein
MPPANLAGDSDSHAQIVHRKGRETAPRRRSFSQQQPKRLKELFSHSTAMNTFSWLRRPQAAIITGTAGPVAASIGTTALI